MKASNALGGLFFVSGLAPMAPTAPEFTPDPVSIEKTATLVVALGSAAGVLWLAGKRLYRFVGKAAFKRELALIEHIPGLERQATATEGIADQFRELLDRHAETQTSIRRVSEDITEMRQEHADGWTKLDDRIRDLSREVSEIRGEMKGRDAAYDRRRT